MKRKIINKNGREKAFLGSLIGGVAGMIGGAISARKQKKAQEAAYKEQQIDQTKMEGNQQAAAMSAQYANQDYVDQYRSKITLKNGGKVKMNKDNDRIAIAKRYKCGGRKKANLGVAIKNDIKSIGEEFRGQNLSNTINSITSAAGNAITPNSNIAPRPGTLQSTATTSSYINAANEIARDAEIRKQQKTSAAKYGTKKKMAYGGRKKTAFGFGSAISGVGSMIGGIFQSSTPQKTIKHADGFAYQAPKTGIEQTSYQVDADGNPVNAVNNNNVADVDRMKQERMFRCGGMKKRGKRK